MPTLEWMGKDKVINHHQQVPFRVLERKYSYDQNGQHDEDNGSENMIIHGDNLEALKALLPRYEGKVQCVYIDPPYNTGNEGWCYNDNVNDPKIQKWLGEVVGKEGEDLSRHDKWLCMMYPRLRLLQKLLAENGIIAVSIDDNEIFHLGCIMNEIFGVKNRLACAPWLSEPSGGKGKSGLRVGHEYLLIYSNGSTEKVSKEEKSVGELDKKDKWGLYRKGRELNKWGDESLREDRPDMWFPLIAPDGTEVYPIRNDGKEGRWRWGRNNPKIVQLLEEPQRAHWEIRPYDDGVSYNGKTERWFPYEKIRDKKKAFGWNTWLDSYGFNSDGTKVIKEIFGEKIFDTVKPLSLVEWIISLYSDDNAIILDSFAGSGSTAHAVINLNKQDGGNRKFILVEMMDYAENITAERVKRVITGSSNYEGVGGDFSYHELGEPLFLPDGNLNEGVGERKIREYVYYMETKESLPLCENIDNKYYLGMNNDTTYYFYYEKKEVTTLDHGFLATVGQKADCYIIYADLCTLSENELKRLNITFKKIPRDIAKL